LSIGSKSALLIEIKEKRSKKNDENMIMVRNIGNLIEVIAHQLLTN
jgi:hypothetical protein